MAEPQLLLNYTGHLPECPTWSAEERALYWADILEGDKSVSSCALAHSSFAFSVSYWKY